MSGVAGIIRWDEQPVESALMRYTIEVIRHRGPDGLMWETKAHLGLGHALLALQKTELQHTQPVWLPDKSCAIVADARLYNREDILNRLGDVSWSQSTPSDAALILAAYERWGQGLLDILDGDFAFAIWDGRRRRVFAARDPFGVKPFFWGWDRRKFFFGSEPKQLLAIPGVPIEPDDMIVGEYLFHRFEELERTFFHGIYRLKPSHFLIATPEGVIQHRYWNPDPEKEIHYAHRQDYFDHFRELLKDAVAKRLQTDFPVGAQLSGGLDSSSIVVMAAEIYHNGAGNLPHFGTISATYPGLPCDESEYIQAVANLAPFRSHTFCPLSEPLTEGLFDELWQIDSAFADLQRGTFNQCARILSHLAAKTLLTGLGGDELVHEEYYLRDLALRKQFILLLRESWIASKTSWNSFARLSFDALKPVVPAPMKRLYRLFRGRKWQPPDWANPEFAEFFAQCPEPLPLPRMGFKSLTQEGAFRFLNFPSVCWALDAMECKGSYNGFEVRHPFFDRPLAEFVLAIPFEERISRGQWKYLLRRSLSSHLPAEVLHRKRKTMFDSYNNYTMSQWISQLRRMLFTSEQWVSGCYVVKEKAAHLFGAVSSPKDLTSPLTAALWRIATLELWLRQLSRYNMCKEV